MEAEMKSSGSLFVSLFMILLASSLFADEPTWVNLPVTSESGDRLQITLENVTPGANAEKAGLKPQDKLLSVNGIDVLKFFTASSRPTANFKILRGADTLTIQCRPKDKAYGIVYSQACPVDSLVFRFTARRRSTMLALSIEVINNSSIEIPINDIVIKSMDNSYASYLYPDEVARELLGAPPIFIPLQKPEKAKEYMVSGSATTLGNTTTGNATVKEKPKGFWDSFSDGLASGYVQGYNSAQQKKVSRYIDNYIQIIKDVDRNSFNAAALPKRGSARGALNINDLRNPYPQRLEITLQDRTYTFLINLPDGR